MASTHNPFGCGRIAVSTGLPCRRPGCDGLDHPAEEALHVSDDARAVLAEHAAHDSGRNQADLAADPLAPLPNAHNGLEDGEQRPLGFEVTDEIEEAIGYVINPMCYDGSCESCGGTAMMAASTEQITRGAATCLLSFCGTQEWIDGAMDVAEHLSDAEVEAIHGRLAEVVAGVKAAWPDL